MYMEQNLELVQKENTKLIFAKLAIARFEAFLRERRMPEDFVKMASARMIKHALMEGELPISGAGLVEGAPDWINKFKSHQTASMLKSPGEYLKQTGRRFKSELTRGTLASPGTMAKGFKSSLGRGINRLFAGLTAYEAANIMKRKREKGTGFFEDIGGRAGEVAGLASLYAPNLGIAGQVAAMMGLPTAGRYAGKAMDVGLRTARQAGRGVRGLFGGGRTFESRKSEAMNKKYQLKADYQK